MVVDVCQRLSVKLTHTTKLPNPNSNQNMFKTRRPSTLSSGHLLRTVTPPQNTKSCDSMNSWCTIGNICDANQWAIGDTTLCKLGFKEQGDVNTHPWWSAPRRIQLPHFDVRRSQRNEEIRSTINLARYTFSCVQFCVSSRREVSLCTKGRVYQRSILLWPARVTDERMLTRAVTAAFWMWGAEIAVHRWNCGVASSYKYTGKAFRAASIWLRTIEKGLGESLLWARTGSASLECLHPWRGQLNWCRLNPPRLNACSTTSWYDEPTKSNFQGSLSYMKNYRSTRWPSLGLYLCVIHAKIKCEPHYYNSNQWYGSQRISVVFLSSLANALSARDVNYWAQKTTSWPGHWIQSKQNVNMITYDSGWREGSQLKQ